MREFLADAEQEHPQLRVHEYEVYFDPDNVGLFQQMAAAYHVEITGVPTAFLGDHVIVGFSEDMRPGIEEMIRQCLATGLRLAAGKGYPARHGPPSREFWCCCARRGGRCHQSVRLRGADPADHGGAWRG